MPYTMTKTDGTYHVTSPHGTKSKWTSKKKAIKQMALLRALEHGSIKPSEVRDRRR